MKTLKVILCLSFLYFLAPPAYAITEGVKTELVKKSEKKPVKKKTKIFLLIGIAFLCASLLVSNLILSTVFLSVAAVALVAVLIASL